MTKVTVRALQPFADYKSGRHHRVGDVTELERTEFEILQALTAQVYEIVEDAPASDAEASEEEETDGKVFSNGADA